MEKEWNVRRGGGGGVGGGGGGTVRYPGGRTPPRRKTKQLSTGNRHDTERPQTRLRHSESTHSLSGRYENNAQRSLSGLMGEKFTQDAECAAH